MGYLLPDLMGTIVVLRRIVSFFSFIYAREKKSSVCGGSGHSWVVCACAAVDSKSNGHGWFNGIDCTQLALC